MKKENNLNLTCHTRPDRVSREMIFNNKELTSAGSSGRANACPKMTVETGRSMVEMLGVLAVMGVLSVGGVAMYTSAMNKHRANELLNEASKRATVVAMQMASGRGANIDEFNVNGTQAFTVSGNAGDTTFTLSVESVDEAVCRQVVNSAGTTGMIQKITSSGIDTAGDASKCTTGALVLTYNADLSRKNIEIEIQKEIEKDDEIVNDCSVENSGYDESSDPYEMVYTGDLTNQKLSNGGVCSCHADYPIWNGSACVSPSSIVCNSSNPCALNEYCRYNITSDSIKPNTSGFPIMPNGSEINGSCEKIVGVKKSDNLYYSSKTQLDWFSSQNWCQAQGGEIIHLSDFSIQTPEEQCFFPEFAYLQYVCASGSSCICKMTNGNQMTPGYWSEMNSKINNLIFWTSDLTTDSSPMSSNLYALLLDLASGSIYTVGLRETGYVRPLCVVK